MKALKKKINQNSCSQLDGHHDGHIKKNKIKPKKTLPRTAAHVLLIYSTHIMQKSPSTLSLLYLNPSSVWGVYLLSLMQVSKWQISNSSQHKSCRYSNFLFVDILDDLICNFVVEVMVKTPQRAQKVTLSFYKLCAFITESNWIPLSLFFFLHVPIRCKSNQKYPNNIIYIQKYR